MQQADNDQNYLLDTCNSQFNWEEKLVKKLVEKKIISDIASTKSERSSSYEKYHPLKWAKKWVEKL